MAVLTLTQGMDQTAKIELADEAGNLEAVVGSMTSSKLIVFESLASVVEVVKWSGQPGTHVLAASAVSIPVAAADLALIPPSKYFGQWSGVVNAKTFVTAVFEVKIEPQVIQ